MCKFCNGRIETVGERDFIHVDTCGRTIRIKAYPDGYEDGVCIYIKRNFCHECGAKLEQDEVCNRQR